MLIRETSKMCNAGVSPGPRLGTADISKYVCCNLNSLALNNDEVQEESLVAVPL